ncbi:hypothetical protein FGADI_9179 [Fusarium gaditjirri]|uniref:Uncharacterized protein n=1 Tax=Fusarium gaditjirri TaxID=282569 RepID=A0A8H4T054_9HYPO|nr:hypothetical protein FGADI_9179 [Fusarium gaditjirri]
MHSTIFALVAVVGYVSAGPTARSQTECSGVGQFYTCANNGFRGYCSVDPCAITWCTDFVEGTCDPVSITKPAVPTETECEEEEGEHWEPETTPASLPEGQCAPGTGFFQSCSNGFRGCCKSDACTGTAGVCPDNNPEAPKPKPETTTETAPTSLPDGQCAPGTGFFQVCSNGFRGCCKSDACTGNAGVCPDNTKRSDDPTVCPPGTGFFQSCSNGFRGCCKSDACSQSQPICPDTIAKRSDDPTVCAPGTGFFQSCSNGFRGCCKSDACSGSAPVCPDTAAKRSDDPTVCPPGTGFFQSCSNGFRGCCKGDACGNTWCPDYKTGTYKPAQTLKVKARSDGTCRPGTGFFQVCANGFKGCCKKDACSQKKPVCPK